MAEIVKSKGSRPIGPVRPLRHGRLATGLALLLPLASLSVTSPGAAQSVLLGPVARRIKAKIELDPRLPSGSLRRDSLALALPEHRACSLTLPLCVGIDPVAAAGNRDGLPGSDATERAMGAALSALETAFRRYVYAARLPAPERRWDPDSGSPAVTWVLARAPSPISVALVPQPNRAFDAAAVVCRSGVADDSWSHGSARKSNTARANAAGGAGARANANGGSDARANTKDGATARANSGHADDAKRASELDDVDSLGGTSSDVGPSLYDRDAALCIGEAIAARLDAAESTRSRSAYAEALWWELGQPTELDLAEVARANALPQKAAVGRDEVVDSASTALFLEYLEQSLGTAAPFGLVTGLFALSGRTQRSDGPRTLNEPDWLDVLRESLGDDRVDFAHRVNAFAAARAQLGTTEGPLGNLAWAGNFSRILPDWVLRVSTLPRRVASKRPIAPLGTVAVRVELDVPTKELSLAVQVEWESPVPFTWTVVKLDAHEQEIGRLDFAFEPRVTNAEKRIVALDGVSSLLVLGTNLGGIDATHLLDPDHAPFEPHGCTVYVVKI